MEKHKDCEHECQQAVEYGVWPERQCSPRCVFLDKHPRTETLDSELPGMWENADFTGGETDAQR